MPYEQLPIVEVGIDEVFLDLENYRIPTTSPDEAAALKYMFASEDVMGAAKLILRDGYFDNEVPIAVLSTTKPPTNQYVVLEGNRRVSALKALHNPLLVPGHTVEVRQLLKRYAVEAENLPKRIRVLVAPDRATAAPHIARLHTGLSKRSWSRDQQATFYYSLLDDENTVEDVKAQYPDVDVVRFVKMAVMRRFLSGVPFVDRTLRQYAKGDQLRMSVFEYAYRNKDIADAIGVKFNGDGTLAPRASDPTKIGSKLKDPHLAALEVLVSGFRGSNGLNTRSPEFKKFTEEHRILMAKLVAPTSSTGNAETMPQGVSGEPPAEREKDTSSSNRDGNQPNKTSSNVAEIQPSTNISPAPRGPNHPDTKNKLDLVGINYEAAPLNLRHRYYELRQIDLSATPMAAALLMRSVLETTIKFHFEASTPVSGELNAVFAQVFKEYGSIKALRNTVNTIKSGGAAKEGSIQWFNNAAHNVDAEINKAEVQRAWKTINPLLRHLLLTSIVSDPSSI